ncbi:MAG: V-type ATPase subunit, partial [Gemmatimonadota bacterium]
LLDPPALESLGREPDLSGLIAGLRRHRILTATTVELPSAESIELGLRRWADAMLRLVGRWAGPRVAALPLVFDDEDRRSLRAIFRGAVQRAPGMVRLAGLIPTPLLPERTLEELAGAPTPERASALLSSWRHPYAEAIAPVATAPLPDLLSLEVALSRAFTARIRDTARRAHCRAVKTFVAESIDLENAITGLTLAGSDRDIVAREMFLAGGNSLSLEGFEQVVRTGSPAAARAAIRKLLADTPYAPAFAPTTTSVEDELLRLRLRTLR